MTSDKNDFEDMLRRGINTPLFKKISIVEMQNLQNGRIWEIKLKDEEETIFAKLMMVDYVINIPSGHFDIITNMFEVDERREKPIIDQQILHDSDIESAYLTQMTL